MTIFVYRLLNSILHYQERSVRQLRVLRLVPWTKSYWYSKTASGPTTASLDGLMTRSKRDWCFKENFMLFLFQNCQRRAVFVFIQSQLFCSLFSLGRCFREYWRLFQRRGFRKQTDADIGTNLWRRLSVSGIDCLNCLEYVKAFSQRKSSLPAGIQTDLHMDASHIFR